MSIRLERMFRWHPPRRPFTDLAAIVEDWKYRFAEGGIDALLRDTVVEYCAAASSLDEAIDRACASRRPNGKMHNHQTRVRKKARDAYADILKRDYALHHVRDFEFLIIICEAGAPAGIGPVTVYDVATRIGAFLKIVPTRVYLHAHVTYGYATLMGIPIRQRYPLPKSIAVKDLPKELHGMPADEIEDFLCTYSSYFAALRNPKPQETA